MKLPTVLFSVARSTTVMTRHWLLLLTCGVAQNHGRRPLVLAVTVLAYSTEIVAALVVGAKTC